MSPVESPAVDALSAVRAAGVAAIDGVLPGGRRERGEPRLDAADRRAVSGDAVLRQPADGGLIGSQSQARATVDAADGDRGDLPASADDLARGRAQDLPVSAAERGDRAARSGVEHGHHVHPVATRLLVPDGDHGLVQSTRAGMAVVEHAHGRLLHRGAGGGAAACDAGDLQQRSGLPVHGRGVHRAIGAPRDRNQHGWPRAPWTTCSSNDCGEASSTRKSTCTTTPTAGRPKSDWGRTSGFMRPSARTKPSATGPPPWCTPSGTEAAGGAGPMKLNDESRERIGNSNGTQCLEVTDAAAREL